MTKPHPWDVLPEAEYFEAPLPEYEGHPLITTMGRILEDRDWAERLYRPPILLEVERGYAPNRRGDCISRLQNIFIPLTMHLELAPAIARLIRRGYLGRNPSEQWRKKVLHILYEAEEADAMPKIPKSLQLRPSSIAVLGPSGCGKTTSLTAILAALGEQVRRHKKHGFVQILWMKFDCPPDKDTRSLALAFMAQIDALVPGSNLVERYDTNISTTRMLVKMIALCIEYNLGLLIVDEIHNLGAKASEEVAEFLNFLKSLYNELGVPHVFLGTRKALDVLGLDFQHLRRTMDSGAHEWDRLHEDEPAWSVVMEKTGQYQWLRKAQIPLSVEVRHALYTESQGIFSLVIALFILSQQRAISTGKELLTPEIIHQVAVDRFTPLLPKLDALRRGDTQALEEIGDLLPVNIEDWINAEGKRFGQLREERVKLDDALQRVAVRKQVTDFLIESHHGKDYAKALVTEAMQKVTTAVFMDILRVALAADQRGHLKGNPDPETGPNPASAGKATAANPSPPAADPLPPDPLDLRTLSKVNEKGDQADIEAIRKAGLVGDAGSDLKP
jgi:hypothetical protein